MYSKSIGKKTTPCQGESVVQWHSVPMATWKKAAKGPLIQKLKSERPHTSAGLRDMILILISCSCLCILSVSCLLAKWIPSFRSSVLAYGKLDLTADQPTTLLSRWLAQWRVPKRWFAHFYVIGLALALWCLIELILIQTRGIMGPIMTLVRILDSPRGADRVPPAQGCQILTLLTLHLSRRVYESFWVEKPSSVAQMHVVHYLAGIGFYGAMVLGTWLEGTAFLGIWPTAIPGQPSCSVPSIISRTVALSFFAWASYHQHRCHVILSALRTQYPRKHKGHPTHTYHLPHGDWFERIVMPHYLGDILIYFSLCLYGGFCSRIMNCGLLWTAINLSITASETETWYRKTFGPRYTTDYPVQRWVILPGIY